MARRSDHGRDELRRMALDAARDIVTRDGLRGLSTRHLAERIGYTAGTLYQLFDDLDDLIAQMNADTLEALADACAQMEFRGGPAGALHRLADSCIRFAVERPKLWSAIFEHALPEGRVLPERHVSAVARLLGLAEAALAPLFTTRASHRRRHEARVLWAGLYGIVALATSRKLAPDETPERLVRSLVNNYVAGLQAKEAGRAAEFR